MRHLNFPQRCWIGPRKIAQFLQSSSLYPSLWNSRIIGVFYMRSKNVFHTNLIFTESLLPAQQIDFSSTMKKLISSHESRRSKESSRKIKVSTWNVQLDSQIKWTGGESMKTKWGKCKDSIFFNDQLIIKINLTEAVKEDAGLWNKTFFSTVYSIIVSKLSRKKKTIVKFLWDIIKIIKLNKANLKLITVWLLKNRRLVRGFNRTVVLFHWTARPHQQLAAD